MRRVILLAIACLSCPAAFVRADEGIPAKTLADLKAATVFVKVEFTAADIGGQRLPGSGSGFLIKADGETGYVATNHHVVTPANPRLFLAGPPTLVFWSGTRKEKSVAAEVVASDPDPERDLAVLKVTGFKDLPAPIDLGQKAELAETMPVFIFGFPLGELLSTTRGNPAMTVGKGSVSSLREDDRGELAFVQLDGELNPGNSGGPVVDAKGRLVGVAVAKIRGTRISMAVPPSLLTKMLNGRVAATGLRAEKAGGNEVRVHVESQLIDPFNKIKSVSLVHVRADALKVKPAPDKDGRWPALPGSQQVELKIDGRKATGSFKVAADDKGKVSLAHQTSFVDGEGRTVHTQPAVFDVSPDPPAVVSKLADPPAPKPDVPKLPDPAPVKIAPAELARERTVIDLPASVGDVTVGGGGRYLVLHLPKVRKLAIFDVNEAKVVKYLGAPADDIKIAAGMDKLLVVQPGNYTVHRWNLTKPDDKPEAEAKIKMEVPPVAVAMGAASNGPLVISGVDYPRLGETAFFDVLSMKRIAVPLNPHGIFATCPDVFLRASADGKVFAAWASGGPQTCVWNGGDLKFFQGDNGTFPVPGPDGRFIFTTNGLCTAELKHVTGNTHCVPAHHGPYYLSFSRADRFAPRPAGERRAGFSVHLVGDRRPLATLTDIEGADGQDLWNRSGLTVDKRVHLIPDAKLLVTIPVSNDRLHLYRFDPDKELEKSVSVR